MKNTLMSDMARPIAIKAAEALPQGLPSGFPAELAARMAGGAKRPLGDPFGLTVFGLNLTRLAPGGGLRPPGDALRLFQGAGLAAAEAEIVAREWHLAAFGELIEAFHRGTVLTAAVIDAQPSAVLAHTRR